MRDPHVESLLYSVASEAGTEYVNPEPLAFENALGHGRIDGGQLRIEPAEHFGDGDEARAAIEPFLKAWEIEADLLANPGTIRFRFKNAHVIDRDPPPPGSPITLHARGGGIATAVGTLTVTISRRSYPQPPRAFRVTTEVEIAFRRWRAYLAGSEPLQGMAYFVLTLLESQAGSRRDAATVFGVDPAILSKIGELSSTRGNAATARKIGRRMQLHDLSGPEKAWLEEAIRRLIHRLGEHASGVAQIPITLKDLPLL